MTYKRDVLAGKHWRRRVRRNNAFCVGFHDPAVLPYRKRQYVAAWANGRALRGMYDRDPGFFNVRST